MTPRHHPSEATLLAYGAGALGEGLGLVVAAHLSFCPDCRSAVADVETVGGSMLEELEPAMLAAGARDRMLSLIAKTDLTRSPLPAPPARLFGDSVVPAPLARYLGGGLEAVQWHIVAPGLSQCEIVPRERLGGGNLRMLRIAKGKKLPRHGHTGTELTLVLKGDYSDEFGNYIRGDLAETDDEVVHEPVSGRDTDCVCVIATEGPLKFDSAIARLFQRFTGF